MSLNPVRGSEEGPLHSRLLTPYYLLSAQPPGLISIAPDLHQGISKQKGRAISPVPRFVLRGACPLDMLSSGLAVDCPVLLAETGRANPPRTRVGLIVSPDAVPGIWWPLSHISTASFPLQPVRLSPGDRYDILSPTHPARVLHVVQPLRSMPGATGSIIRRRSG